jgi:hypothetical protein
MEIIEVYVRGNARTPQRFWDYALRTNTKQDSGGRMYVDTGFIFSQRNTDLFKSLSENARKRVRFFYINGVKWGDSFGKYCDQPT